MFQVPSQEDTAAVDSLRGIVPESPLPGGAAEIVRFFFNVPQWIQIGGAVLGAIAGVSVAVFIWRRRVPIFRWAGRQSQSVRIGLVTAGLVVVTAAALASLRSWNYMQYDNDFCTACHVMDDPFTRFTQSEHDSLSCHDCHQQSIFASTRQLYLWVAERPVEISEHAPVPDRICENCHVTGEAEVWQRVRETAGHRTHYESDSTSLDSIMCVTCHGQELHRFVPVDQTCGQSGCHSNQDITLAGMADQTSLHCAACHQFATEVPLLATTDSARGTLRPALSQCNTCHEMREALADFVTELDPHAGTCGMCHNPHTQLDAGEARQTCTTSGCHEAWDTEPFHTGVAHVDVARSCTTCHQPHQARVDASDCQGCHIRVADNPALAEQVGERLRSVMPFDTTAALRRTVPDSGSSPTQSDNRQRFPFWSLQTHGPPGIGWWAMSPPTADPDSFSHDEHDALQCLTCHASPTGHGALTFEAPRGCQICHHQAPETLDCTNCHVETAIPALQVTLAITIADTVTRERTRPWDHGVHASMRCVQCHLEPVTLTTSVPVQTCTSCHDDHHQAARECATCHTDDAGADVHRPPTNAHVGCTACHLQETIVGLTPDRPFCLTCHQSERTDHFDEAASECTTCHFLATPEQFRRRLIGTAQ